MNRLIIEEVKLESIDLAVEKILAFAEDFNIWILLGEMGAGKTTLVKAICKAMNVLDNVSSPTFSIVNEYLTTNDETLYHFDFYRIEHEQEARDIGCEEYFYSENRCFIEWPSKIPNLIPEQRVEISISIVNDYTRSINVTKYG